MNKIEWKCDNCREDQIKLVAPFKIDQVKKYCLGCLAFNFGCAVAENPQKNYFYLDLVLKAQKELEKSNPYSIVYVSQMPAEKKKERSNGVD